MSTWIGRARSVGQSAPVAVALLLLANLLPLAGVLWFGWDVGMVLITYWLENGIVGLVNIPKILLAKGEGPGAANRTFIAVFFLSNLLLKSGEGAYLPPFFAAWSVNIVFAVAGIALFWYRSRNRLAPSLNPLRWGRPEN